MEDPRKTAERLKALGEIADAQAARTKAHAKALIDGVCHRQWVKDVGRHMSFKRRTVLNSNVFRK